MIKESLVTEVTKAGRAANKKYPFTSEATEVEMVVKSHAFVDGLKSYRLQDRRAMIVKLEAMCHTVREIWEKEMS